MLQGLRQVVVANQTVDSHRSADRHSRHPRMFSFRLNWQRWRKARGREERSNLTARSDTTLDTRRSRTGVQGTQERPHDPSDPSSNGRTDRGPHLCRLRRILPADHAEAAASLSRPRPDPTFEFWTIWRRYKWSMYTCPAAVEDHRRERFQKWSDIAPVPTLATAPTKNQWLGGFLPASWSQWRRGSPRALARIRTCTSMHTAPTSGV
jgi:hypothetical protein